MGSKTTLVIDIHCMEKKKTFIIFGLFVLKNIIKVWNNISICIYFE